MAAEAKTRGGKGRKGGAKKPVSGLYVAEACRSLGGQYYVRVYNGTTDTRKSHHSVGEVLFNDPGGYSDRALFWLHPKENGAAATGLQNGTVVLATSAGDHAADVVSISGNVELDAGRPVRLWEQLDGISCIPTQEYKDKNFRVSDIQMSQKPAGSGQPEEYAITWKEHIDMTVRHRPKKGAPSLERVRAELSMSATLTIDEARQTAVLYIRSDDARRGGNDVQKIEFSLADGAGTSLKRLHYNFLFYNDVTTTPGGYAHRVGRGTQYMYIANPEANQYAHAKKVTGLEAGDAKDIYGRSAYFLKKHRVCYQLNNKLIDDAAQYMKMIEYIDVVQNGLRQAGE
jgi:hypothetical protein